jgi:hypothetical protein
MNRVASAIANGCEVSLRNGYERVLRLTHVAASGRVRPAFRRELLRWRDMVAELYLSDSADWAAHRNAFRALLRMTSVAARRIPLLEATR